MCVCVCVCVCVRVCVCAYIYDGMVKGILLWSVAHQSAFGHIIFLKMVYGCVDGLVIIKALVDTEDQKIFNMQCLWGSIFVSL